MISFPMQREKLENNKETRYPKQGYGENVKKGKENNREDFDISIKKETLHLVKP